MKDDNCIFCKLAAGDIPTIPYMRMIHSVSLWMPILQQRDIP